MTNEDEQQLATQLHYLQSDRATLASYADAVDSRAMATWGERVMHRAEEVAALEEKIGLRSSEHVRAARAEAEDALRRVHRVERRIARRASAVDAGAHAAATPREYSTWKRPQRGWVTPDSWRPQAESAPEADYELVECSRCKGSGRLDDDLMCPECMGKGEIEENQGQPDQPPKRNKFDDAPADPKSPAPRKPKPEARHDNTSAAQPQRGRTMEKPNRTITVDGTTIPVKGSPEFMDMARAYAAEHKVSLEEAMVKVAGLAPSLAR